MSRGVVSCRLFDNQQQSKAKRRRRRNAHPVLWVELDDAGTLLHKVRPFSVVLVLAKRPTSRHLLPSLFLPLVSSGLKKVLISTSFLLVFVLIIAFVDRILSVSSLGRQDKDAQRKRKGKIRRVTRTQSRAVPCRPSPLWKAEIPSWISGML